ncbi:Benzene 1,2-dioxygenase subunit beta [Xylophilus ampelinus]|nr:Benzene 1,2-dioxygenase subunit beta [Xylophilus ampelinus]
MNALGDAQLYFAVRSFQARECAALQAADYDTWLGMMAAEVRYRVPVMSVMDDPRQTEAGPRDLAHYDDTLETLKIRVARMRSRMAWTEIPPSRVRYFVDPLTIRAEGDDILVASNFMVYQTRLQREENWYVGRRDDRLRRSGDDLLLVERVAVIDRTVLPGKNLTIFV